jgi:hypothetical protein
MADRHVHELLAGADHTLIVVDGRICAQGMRWRPRPTQRTEMGMTDEQMPRKPAEAAVERRLGTAEGTETGKAVEDALGGPFAPRRPLVELIADAIPVELTATPHVGIGDARRLNIARAVLPVVEAEFDWLSRTLADTQRALRAQIAAGDELRRKVDAVRALCDDADWIEATRDEKPYAPLTSRIRQALDGGE